MGGWQLDTIVGKGHQEALVSSVNRCSKYTFLGLLKTKTADELNEMLVKRINPYKHLVHTSRRTMARSLPDMRGFRRSLAHRFTLPRLTVPMGVV